MGTVSPDDARLLLDAMLGKLATYLRMCGYDAAYALDRSVEDDDAVLALARAEGRTLVTRDAALAERAGEDALLLRTKEVADQLRELRDAGFELSLGEPVRCSRCNGRLVRVTAGEATPEYAPDPDEEAVWRCPACGQCYWRGSHWDDVSRRLNGL